MNEMKHLLLEVKLAHGDGGGFEGIASVYGNVDSYGDIVEPGAFSKSIRERGANVPILWQHNAALPIGSGEVYETSSGLAIRGRILDTVTQGREALALLRAGAVKGLSIGYRTIKDAWDVVRKTRRLVEVKLYEVSVVTFPANELATVGAVGLAGGSGKADTGGDVLKALREIRDGQHVTAALRDIRAERRR
ncbi:MAG: HK97 family phage prohead protease [Acidobacteria bacterium]|nr:HK97 family phage prohead protease [Acidobacteriota bacterium]